MFSVKHFRNVRTVFSEQIIYYTYILVAFKTYIYMNIINKNIFIKITPENTFWYRPRF
jgi:hypothetical protein